MSMNAMDEFALRPECKQEYFGKYRGTVVNNEDPRKQGRVQVIVPAVSPRSLTNWAMPCLPFAGMQSGMFTTPPVGSSVWIEFEQGDPDFPIWTGGFWGSVAEVPPSAFTAAPGAPNVVFQSVGQNAITIYGDPAQGIELRAGAMADPTAPSIKITKAGILIQVGASTVEVTAAGVSINKGALTVSSI